MYITIFYPKLLIFSLLSTPTIHIHPSILPHTTLIVFEHSLPSYDVKWYIAFHSPQRHTCKLFLQKLLTCQTDEQSVIINIGTSIHLSEPVRIAQLAGNPTCKSEVLGSISVWPHTFVSPSADSRGAVVSYWRKYVHEVLVIRLGGCPGKVWLG